MTGRVRTAPGMVSLFVTAPAVPAAPACSIPVLLPKLWSRYLLDRAQGLSTHPDTGSCARNASPPLLVEPVFSCQSRLASCEGGLASQAPAGSVAPGWRCCPARCWLVPLVLPLLCTPGRSSRERSRGEGSWWWALAHRRPVGMGEQQHGGAGAAQPAAGHWLPAEEK